MNICLECPIVSDIKAPDHFDVKCIPIDLIANIINAVLADRTVVSFKAPGGWCDIFAEAAVVDVYRVKARITVPGMTTKI